MLTNNDIDATVIGNSKVYASTISNTRRSFQYRIIHLIIGNNAKAFRYGLEESNICDMCVQGEENYRHLFIECNKGNKFWIDVKQWIAKKADNRN